jgi:hypothetical protein
MPATTTPGARDEDEGLQGGHRRGPVRVAVDRGGHAEPAPLQVATEALERACLAVGAAKMVETPKGLRYSGLTMHDLRHALAQWTSDAGTPINKVQDMLRHSSPAMTRGLRAPVELACGRQEHRGHHPEEESMSERVSYWHGGQAGRRVGTQILPPSRTNAKNTLYGAGTAVVARRDRVYVTTDFGAALLYAVGHPSNGHVYKVEPVGPLTPDPDCSLSGLSWECESATILRVHKPTGKEKRMVLRALSHGGVR